jgi:excisionase family DNA binding protein
MGGQSDVPTDHAARPEADITHRIDRGEALNTEETPDRVTVEDPFEGLPLLIAVPRAARLLGISRASAYRLTTSGELPNTRLGGRVYVITAELRAIVRAA